MRTQIFSDFATPSEILGAMRSWGKDIKYRNIEFVCDNNFTHAVIINTATPSLSIPKENVMTFMWEPYELLNMPKFMEYNKKNSGCIINHDRNCMNGPIVKEWIPFLPPLPLNQTYNPVKTNIMSIIASTKSYLPGHSLRHQIIQRILKSDLDIHIYGNGIESIYGKEDHRIKGTLVNKEDGLLPYLYTISLENTKYNYYVTEKFTDPIICNCVPLYWGANCITNVYGNESHFDLPNTTNADEIFDCIKVIFNNPSKYLKDTSKVINQLKDTNNLPHYIWSHFNER